jgi:predicted P-loop ATPase
MNISLFSHINQTKNGEMISVLDFLNGLRFGKWKDVVAKIQAEKDVTKRRILKGGDKANKVRGILPYVTPCGVFKERNNQGLSQPSGLMSMDFDHLTDVPAVKAKLIEDPYTYAVSKSVGGDGVFVLVKIETGKHADAFLALDEYYQKNFGLICDQSCKDLSRARYVSYDPDLYVNEKSRLFKSYLPKKALKKAPEIIFGTSDVDFVIKQIQDNRVDLTHGQYDRFLRIGFALCSHFGAGGGPYFHTVAALNEKYDPAVCEQQWQYIVKSRREGVTMGTFFHYAKEAGLSIVTRETQQTAAVAKQAKRQGRTPESASRILEEMEGITPEESQDVIDAVFGSDVDLKTMSELPLLEAMELFLHSFYRLERNEITRNIENKREPLDTKDFNTIWIQAVKTIGDTVRFETLERLINSDFTPTYNPVREWFENNAHRSPEGCIAALAATIESDTGFDAEEFDPSFVEDFLRRWLVGVVSSAFGKYSPLLLVLSGEKQNTGKTEFFRRLLPDKLQKYYGESKLDAGKDDEILMTQKLILMDDEMGGKGKTETKRLKELTSKQVFTLREPYGRKNVDLARLAVLCGTSNDNALLSDPTGNRRIIPIHVLSINHSAYNAINKDDLFAEAYHLWRNGFEWELKTADIARLNSNTTEFEQVRAEFELITQFFRKPDIQNGEKGQYLTTTEIKTLIEKTTQQRISSFKIGAEMKAAGFKLHQVGKFGQRQKVYNVVRLAVDPETGGTAAPVPMGLGLG